MFRLRKVHFNEQVEGCHEQITEHIDTPLLPKPYLDISYVFKSARTRAGSFGRFDK